MYYSQNPAQKAYIRKAIKADIRLDGRKTTELKKTNITQGVLNQAQGSAILVAPFEHITIYSSIKLQLVRRLNNQQQPPITASVESVRRRLDQSNPKDSLDSTHLKILEQLLEQMLISHLSRSNFLIHQSQQHMLKVNIDIFLLNYVHLSNLDMIYQVAKASIADLKIPQMKVIKNELTGEEDIEVTEDFMHYQDMKTLPDVFLIGEIENQLVCDLTQDEFQSMDNVFVLSMLDDRILGLRQLYGQVQPEALLKVIKFASKVHQTHKIVEHQANV